MYPCIMVCNDGEKTGEKHHTKKRLCAISGRGLVIFGQWRRGAVTACGLRTEGAVFFLERGGLRGAGAGRGGTEE